MTAQKLVQILSFLDDLDKTLGIQTKLEAVRDALDNLVASPAEPEYQSKLAGALESFVKATAKLSQSITPSQVAMIKEMGGEEFFDPGIGNSVTESVQKNA